MKDLSFVDKLNIIYYNEYMNLQMDIVIMKGTFAFFSQKWYRTRKYLWVWISFESVTFNKTMLQIL